MNRLIRNVREGKPLKFAVTMPALASYSTKSHGHMLRVFRTSPAARLSFAFFATSSPRRTVLMFGSSQALISGKDSSTARTTATIATTDSAVQTNETTSLRQTIRPSASTHASTARLGLCMISRHLLTTPWGSRRDASLLSALSRMEKASLMPKSSTLGTGASSCFRSA